MLDWIDRRAVQDHSDRHDIVTKDLWARGRRDGSFEVTSFAALLLWCVAHIYFLIGFRHHLSVAMN